MQSLFKSPPRQRSRVRRPRLTVPGRSLFPAPPSFDNANLEGLGGSIRLWKSARSIGWNRINQAVSSRASPRCQRQFHRRTELGVWGPTGYSLRIVAGTGITRDKAIFDDRPVLNGRQRGKAPPAKPLHIQWTPPLRRAWRPEMASWRGCLARAAWLAGCGATLRLGRTMCLEVIQDRRSGQSCDWRGCNRDTPDTEQTPIVEATGPPSRRVSNTNNL